MNKFVKAISNDDLYIEFLQSLNGILQLTDREMELMVTLIKLDINYTKLPGISKNVVNTENRKYIMKSLGLTKDNLSRYIGKFKEKGYLIQGIIEDEITINKALIPIIINDRVQITIILKTKKNEDPKP